MKNKLLASGEALDFNPEFERALDLLENSQKSVFVMGKAGTGKSTLLNYFKENTSKKIAVLAPTGVAAVNIKGQTVHSFFKFKPNVTLESVKRLRKKTGEKKNIYQKLDAIIIDEISMVRADLIDCVDKFLRLNGKDPHKPFGGLKMIFIGDLYQLPPVVSGAEKSIFQDHYKSPYFFSAHLFDSFDMDLVELEHVYRQKDQNFINILNAIRNNTVTSEDLDALNQRVDPDFSPPENDFYIYLVPTNAYAESINEERVSCLKGDSYHFEGATTGNFEKGQFPTLLNLTLKEGAQIMMMNNDIKGRWINGTIGKVLRIDNDPKEGKVVVTELETGDIVSVGMHTWEIYKFSLEDSVIKVETTGTFTQYPMKLAWAITIHKSQGKTFNHAIIDVGKSVFTSGQTYVALSRCTNLKGMVLKKPITKKHIWSDYNIVKFVTQYQYDKSEQAWSLEDKIAFLTEAADKQQIVDMVYLKASDVKSKRQIIPIEVGPMSYMSKSFEGVIAYCLMRREERVFRVDRILEAKLKQ